MNNFVQKLKVFLGVTEDYDHDEEGKNFAEPAEEVLPFSRERKKQTNTRKPNLVGLAGGQSGHTKMHIVEPTAFEDVKMYVNYLRNRKSMILRLHSVNKNEAQRIVDFMSGATHALDGNMRKLGETIFCFTPSSVIIEGDLETDFFEMLRNEGN
ncbi:MAG: cell division protein SepF [Bacillota bacterium]|nr:cell division protein SepF [Bacillota bacterium]